MRQVALLACLLLVAACGQPAAIEPTNSPAPPVTSKPAATRTVSPIAPEEPAPSATPAAATPRPEPGPEPTETAIPPPTALQAALRQATDFPAGPIRQLWVSPEGNLWVLTEDGLYARQDPAWETLSFAAPLALIGNDTQDRVWAIFDQGNTVAYLAADTNWISYGPTAGWTTAELGPFLPHMSDDDQGQLWLAWGRNGLRLLDDGSRFWATLDNSWIGFDRPPPSTETLSYDSRLALTDVAVDHQGRVWSSACNVWLFHEDSPQPVVLGEGRGVRRLSAGQWEELPETDGYCWQNISVAPDGQVWLAGKPDDLWGEPAQLLRYHPAGDQWLAEPVPESSGLFQENPRFAKDIQFDSQGRGWLFVARRGGATFPPDAVYIRQAGQWQPFLERLPGRFAFGRQDDVWLMLDEAVPYGQQTVAGLVHLAGERVTTIRLPADGVQAESLVIDGENRAWLIGRDGQSLWFYDPDGR